MAEAKSGAGGGPRLKVDIEQLVVWALVEQGLGWDSGGAGIASGLGMIAELGTVVSSGGAIGSPSVSLWTDDDALPVAAAIKALPQEMGGLVFLHGRASSRPDWAPEGYGEPQPLRDKRGRPRVEYQYPTRRNKGEATVLYDHLAHSQRVATVDYFRAAYALWWRGLQMLVPVVNAHMVNREATGPAVAREPWLAEVAGPLPAAAAARVRAYEEGTGSLLGTLTVDELRDAAQVGVRARASVWGPGESGVDLDEARPAGGSSGAD